MNRSEWLKKQRDETDKLEGEALKLGIEIPSHESWWWDDFDNFDGSPQDWELLGKDYTYLTDLGKAGVRKLIRDEQRKEDEWRRARVEWRVKIIVSIISALTGLVGALIGVLAILRR